MRIQNFILFILLISSNVQGQDLLESESRKIKTEVFKLIDAYKENCPLKDEDQKSKFPELFLNSMASLIPNDILPANKLNEIINVEEYLNLTENWPKVYTLDPPIVGIRVYRVKIEPSVSNSRSGKVYVDAMKNIYVYSGKYNRYEDTIDIRFEIQYDLKDETYLIESIKTNKTHKNKYVTIKIKNQNSDKNTYDPNLFNQIKINNIIYDLTFPDGSSLLKTFNAGDKVKVTPVSNDFISSKVIEIPENEYDSERLLRFKRKNIYVGPSNTFFKQNKSIDVLGDHSFNGVLGITGSKSEFHVGLVLYRLSNTPWDIGIEVGYGITQIRYELGLPEYIESHLTADMDNHLYLRTTRILDINEQGDISFTQIPIGLKLNYRLDEITDGLIWFTGFKFSHVIDSKLNRTTTADVYHSGLYGPEFLNLNIFENDVYDFGYFSVDNSDIQSLVGLDQMIQYSSGFQYQVTKRIFMEATCSYWSINDQFLNRSERLSSGTSLVNSVFLKTQKTTLNGVNFEFGVKYYL